MQPSGVGAQYVKEFAVTDGNVITGCGAGGAYQFAFELLRNQKVLVTAGTGFNWQAPDHFRIVFLPDLPKLKVAMDRIAKYLETKKRHR